MLAIEDLKVHFRVERRGRGSAVLKAVDDVTLTLERGQAFGLVGESGSGKSTIGKAALHLVPITGGHIDIDGRDVTQNTPDVEKWLRRKAQMVFQDPHSALNPRMTIMRSVAEPLVLHTARRGADLKRRVSELLEIVGLSRQFLYRFPHELSGGQKQRVCIARAIALNPDLLILDEPTSALDVSVQSQILEFLKDLQAEFGLTYLFISHNLAVVRYLCDRVAVMYLGEIVEEGATESIFRNPRHPYTKALLKSIPYPQAVQPERGQPLSGDIPSPIDTPTGCRFHTRCPETIAGVCDVRPPRSVVQEGMSVRCHLFADDGNAASQ